MQSSKAALRYGGSLNIIQGLALPGKGVKACLIAHQGTGFVIISQLPLPSILKWHIFVRDQGVSLHSKLVCGLLEMYRSPVHKLDLKPSSGQFV